ncbi:hypothetical protein MVEN_02633300 [Mycena venus]|uniref:Uncharacterized protein n=1 Tax=Mycena venus TaxID=2733690 RepID=A0A8H6TY00_9AGAR|nr:hypothetical protein MVEN_02633300 [Mycena venus]
MGTDLSIQLPVFKFHFVAALADALNLWSRLFLFLRSIFMLAAYLGTGLITITGISNYRDHQRREFYLVPCPEPPERHLYNSEIASNWIIPCAHGVSCPPRHHVPRSPMEPGILINIYCPIPATYTQPGPAVWTG